VIGVSSDGESSGRTGAVGSTVGSVVVPSPLVGSEVLVGVSVEFEAGSSVELLVEFVSESVVLEEVESVVFSVKPVSISRGTKLPFGAKMTETW
jgi:hypothetical protein